MFHIYFVDSCEDPGRREEDYPNLKRLEERWMVKMGSLATLDPVAGMNKRDDARAGARNWGIWRGSGNMENIFPRFF